MSDQGPTVFNDRYELHRKLARGGMSDVYLARDLLLDRPVAVKVLFPEYAKDPTFVERFRREAQAAANLNHPNIVAIYDWGQQSGTYFIVMEYVEGRSLSEIIRTDGPLHPRRSAEITADVAAALGFAHRNGVVHRDVKPGNIIISPTGQVKVADFGIAQAITGGAEQQNLTQAGAVMGTATYFSPEQAQGKPVDPRSDLYSLGCVLFEMLTSRPPFTGDTPVAIAYQHVQQVAPLPSASGVDVPPALEAIDVQLLAKDPAERFASAEDLRADLRNYLEGLPVSALRSPVVLAAGIAGGAAVGVATQAVPSVGSAPVVAPSPAPVSAATPAATGPSEHPANRSTRFLWVLLAILLVLAVGLFVWGTQLNRNANAQVQVNKVTGLTKDAAIQSLTDQGFKVNAVDQPNADIQAGTVVSQNPGPGESADKGSVVTITVSSGAGQKEVPDVTGKTRAQAKSLIEGAGFVYKETPQQDPTATKDTIISQTPGPKTQADQGADVTVVYSSGPATVEVPDVTGQSEATASANLVGAGFKVTSVDQSSTTVNTGKVISTNPDAGTQVAPGSTIKIFVSTGPPSTTSTSTTSTTKPPASSTTTTTKKTP
ncbi:MAG TPA: Stk1 family PASTA domain-containing Ser/Thr kinase [Acidimicrobiales bacterium]